MRQPPCIEGAGLARGIATWLIYAAVSWPAQASAQIIISEVMFDPSGSEFYDEFIEIQNLSDQSLDLRGWRIGDAEEADEILAHEGGTVLEPGSFGLILDSGHFEHSSTYDPLPEGALVLTVADATLGKGGLSNSKPEQIVLVSSAGDTIAAMRYELGNAPGFSEEKIDPMGDDLPGNWTDSRWVGGTPGRTNSVSQKANDLAVAGDSGTPLKVVSGETLTFEFRIVNEGVRDAGPFSVEVSASGPGLIFGEEIEFLEAGGSIPKFVEVGALEQGHHEVSAEVIFPADQDRSNNRYSRYVIVGAQPRQVVVNEVMFSPQSDQPEWIEIFNRSETSVDILGWQIQDRRPDPVELPAESSLRLAPAEYVVITEDADEMSKVYPGLEATLLEPKKWPRLNDSGDAVVIKDGVGSVVDSATYDGADASQTQGRSLERIDPDGPSRAPENWLFSTDGVGATPGRPNSVSVSELSEAVMLSVSPNPFRDRVEITYQVPTPRASVNLWVYDRLGRRVRALLNGEPGGAQRLVVWDGLGERGSKLKPGIYILYMEALDPDGRIHRTRTPVVMAKGL